jgi:hypothetical protein
MIIGYGLCATDNHVHFWGDRFDNAYPICPECGFIIDENYISPNFKLRSKKFDLSATYDCRYIASQAFADFCLDGAYHGVDLVPLPNDPGYYWLRIHNIIEFDVQRASLTYDRICSTCKRYYDVTPAYPIFLKNRKLPSNDGFFATDQHFAYGNSQSPVFIIGVKTYEKMRDAKFSGIETTEIIEDLT